MTTCNIIDNRRPKPFPGRILLNDTYLAPKSILERFESNLKALTAMDIILLIALPISKLIYNVICSVLRLLVSSILNVVRCVSSKLFRIAFLVVCIYVIFQHMNELELNILSILPILSPESSYVFWSTLPSEIYYYISELYSLGIEYLDTLDTPNTISNSDSSLYI